MVTEDTKSEFVQKWIENRIEKPIKFQLEALKFGLDLVVPKTLLRIVSDFDFAFSLVTLLVQFEAAELETIISGEPEINLDRLKKVTNYEGYAKSGDDPIIVRFWELMKTYDHEKRGSVLQFVTGSKRIYLGRTYGRKRGYDFEIKKDSSDDLRRLPQARTCK